MNSDEKGSQVYNSHKLLARDGGHHRDIYTFGKFKDQSGNYEN